MNPYAQKAVQNKLQASDPGQFGQRQIATERFSYGSGGYKDNYHDLRQQMLRQQATMPQDAINSALGGIFGDLKFPEFKPSTVQYNFPELKLPSWLNEPPPDYSREPEQQQESSQQSSSGGGGYGGYPSAPPPEEDNYATTLGRTGESYQTSTTRDGNYYTSSYTDPTAGYFQNSPLRKNPQGYLAEGGLSSKSPYSGWQDTPPPPNPLGY